jgi:hypothetical protein
VEGTTLDPAGKSMKSSPIQIRITVLGMHTGSQNVVACVDEQRRGRLYLDSKQGRHR